MTLPAVLPTAARFNAGGALVNGRHLWAASDGDIYFLGITPGSGAADEVSMWRSTDGGNTWDTAVETDREGEGPPNADVIMSVSAARDGDELHVWWGTGSYASGMDTLVDYEFQRFDMDANTWTSTSELVETADDPQALARVTVARRTSDIVVLFNGDSSNVMGNAFSRVFYIRGTAGSWEAPTGVDSGGENDWQADGCVVGGQAGECHFIFSTGTQANGALDARTLDGANSMSTVVTRGTSLNGHRRGAPAIAWLDSDNSTWRIGLASESLSAGVDLSRWTEDGSDDIANDSPGLTVNGVNSEDPKTIAFSDTDHDLYAFYVPGGATRLIDYKFSEDGTETFLGEVTDWNGTDLFGGNGLHAVEFTHSSGNGGATVIGVVWAETGAGGDVWYDEVVIAAGAVDASLVYRPNPYGARLAR
jgi:hypothetical protein